MKCSKESIVSCNIESAVATIVMDDGNRNVISPRMLDQLNRALDKAEKARAVVVLTGREDVFSAGFDLKIMKNDVLGAYKMLVGGFLLAKRLLSFPMPVVLACNGHAVAMGSFLLLSADYRLGADVEARIVANEVEIGLTMPHSAIAICRQRLTPAHFERAVLLSELFSPRTAVDAGFLDTVVPRSDLQARAAEKAGQLASLDLEAHRRSKLRVRRSTQKALRRAIRADRSDFILKGLQLLLGKR